MKKISLLILAFAGVASSAAAQPRIAFERQPSVWIANIDGSGQRKIADGINPDLSPDGRFLAFNTVEPRQLHRLAIADLDSGRITILKEIPSEDCEQPNWSRDGRKLLFVFDAKTNERHVGIVNADGSGFRDVQAGLAYDIYYTPVWAADGQSFFCEENQRSGNYIYRVGLDGRVMRRWLEVSGNLIQQALPGGSLIPGGELSGWMPIHASPDGTSLLLNAEMSGEGSGENEVYTAPAIWTMDLATGKVNRRTPRGMPAWSGEWLDSNHILFTSPTLASTQSEEFSVFRMSLTGHGNDRKELIRNADTPSAGGH